MRKKDDKQARCVCHYCKGSKIKEWRVDNPDWNIRSDPDLTPQHFRHTCVCMVCKGKGWIRRGSGVRERE